ncbi:MAG: helix-turn-helix domain-containing protein, partial [Kofleriaceae bacterium]
MKLTVREAAAVLDVAEAQIYRWVEHEDIPFVMIHQRPRFHRLELFEWAIDRELPIRGDLYEGDRDQPFTRALERGGPPVVIRDPSELAPEIPVDAEVIGAILLARAGALLVAHPALGVAIPRARSPIICPEVSATVMLRWCEPALAIGAASVGAMFLILAPTIK